MSYIGTTKIWKMYLGTIKIAKAYLGDSLVFQNTPAAVTETITRSPSSYDTTNSSFRSWQSSSYNDSKGYTSATSTSEARATLITGSGAESKVYWKFDLSAIPVGATIESVSLKVKARISNTNTSYVASCYLAVCNGTTVVGAQSNVTSNTATTFDLDVGSGWTRDSIQNLSILNFAKRGASNTTSTYYMGFYGATLTVKYSYIPQ